MSYTPTFEELYTKDISKHVEKLKKTYEDKKTGQQKSFELSYLSWAYGWREMKRIDPYATETIHEFPLITNNGVFETVKVPYLMTPQGYFVKDTVTINGRSETEILPVLDSGNKPIKNPSSFQINTSLKRCFVKALAKHGIGLYLYVGEDLPEDISKPINQADLEQLEELEYLFEEIAQLKKISAKTVKNQLLAKKEYAGKFEDISMLMYEELRALSIKQIEKLNKEKAEKEAEEKAK